MGIPFPLALRELGSRRQSWVPLAWGAFEDYRLSGTSFSGPALEALRALIDETRLNDEAYLEELKEKSGLSAREFREFLASLKGDPAGRPRHASGRIGRLLNRSCPESVDGPKRSARSAQALTTGTPSERDEWQRKAPLKRG